jgi:hypothetical protein
MTQKEYNKVIKHLSKVEKIMNYKQGSLPELLKIPKPSEPKSPTATKMPPARGPILTASYMCPGLW